MDSIALLLKSYRGDLAYAQRLVESFQRYNSDGLSLHCVVPSLDLPIFEPLCGRNMFLHAEEEVGGPHLTNEPIGGVRVGYANQEIVKICFWETGLAANYFCVDSDAVFLRPFFASDFMRDHISPYTVLVEDKDLLTEPTYFTQHWQGREEAIRRIMALVELDDPIMRTSHGHQVFSSKVLESFRNDFLRPRGWTYADAIKTSPYEFSWYAMWLQKSQAIPIIQREPLVKVYHDEEQHLAAIVGGIGPKDLARAYVAVVVNSNYSRSQGLVSAHRSKPQALAPYISYGDLRALMGIKVRSSLTRRRE